MKKCSKCGVEFDGEFCPNCEKQEAQSDLEALQKELKELELEKVRLQIEKLKKENEQLKKGVETKAEVAPKNKKTKVVEEVQVEESQEKIEKPAKIKPEREVKQRTAEEIAVIKERTFKFLPMVLVLLFSILNFAWFATPFAKIFGESIGNFYDFCFGSELLDKDKRLMPVFIFAIISLLFALVYAYNILAKKDSYVRIFNKKIDISNFMAILSVLVYLIMLIMSIVCMSIISKQELDNGACAILILVFSILFLLGEIALVYLQYTNLKAKGEKMFTPCEFVEKLPNDNLYASINRKSILYRIILGLAMIFTMIVYGAYTLFIGPLVYFASQIGKPKTPLSLYVKEKKDKKNPEQTKITLRGKPVISWMIGCIIYIIVMSIIDRHDTFILDILGKGLYVGDLPKLIMQILVSSFYLLAGIFIIGVISFRRNVKYFVVKKKGKYQYTETGLYIKENYPIYREERKKLLAKYKQAKKLDNGEEYYKQLTEYQEKDWGTISLPKKKISFVPIVGLCLSFVFIFTGAFISLSTPKAMNIFRVEKLQHLTLKEVVKEKYVDYAGFEGNSDYDESKSKEIRVYYDSETREIDNKIKRLEYLLEEANRQNDYEKIYEINTKLYELREKRATKKVKRLEIRTTGIIILDMDYNESLKEVKKVVPSKKTFSQNATELDKIIELEVYYKDGSYVKIFNAYINVNTSIVGEQEIILSTPFGTTYYTFNVV